MYYMIVQGILQQRIAFLALLYKFDAYLPGVPEQTYELIPNTLWASLFVKNA